MRYFGFARETTFGVAPSTADMWLDIGKCGIDPPDDPNIQIDSIEETPSKQKKGFYSPSGTTELATDVNSMLRLLQLACGGYQYTEGGTGEKNMHEIYISSNRVLDSFTTFIGKDNGGADDYEYQTYGNVISKIGIEISDSIAKTSFDVAAQKDGLSTLREYVPIDESYPMAFYEAHATNNGVDVSEYTNNFSWELDNGITATDGQGLASMFPYKFRSNGKTSTIKSTLEFQGKDYLQRFWGGADGPKCTTTYFPYAIDFEDEEGADI